MALIVDIFVAVILFMPVCICLLFLNINIQESSLPFLVWGIIFCKDCFGGRSVGKRFLGYQVIDIKTKQPANPFKCVLRNLFIPLGILDIGFMFYHSQWRRLGDYITYTQVVKYDKRNNKTKYLEALFAIICVFIIVIIINMIFEHFASLF